MLAPQGSLLPLDYALEPNDSPTGKLFEFSGKRAREAAIKILKQHPNATSVWIEKKLHPLSREIRLASINRKKVLFVNGGSDSSWALFSFLRMRIFNLLVFSAPYSARERRILRRAAQHYGTEIVLLNPNQP